MNSIHTEVRTCGEAGILPLPVIADAAGEDDAPGERGGAVGLGCHTFFCIKRRWAPLQKEDGLRLHILGPRVHDMEGTIMNGKSYVGLVLAGSLIVFFLARDARQEGFRP
jgi:hypothetical protein